MAENLDQASRIAYGATRHRVVTLNGELIEVSGKFSTFLKGKKLDVLGNKKTVLALQKFHSFPGVDSN